LSHIEHNAIIETGASIGQGTTIGHNCHIGKHVIIGTNNHIADHVVISGNTTIGNHNSIAAYTVLGTAPQDIKPTSADVSLEIGNHNAIDSHVLISCGTDGGGKITHIGDHNRLMKSTHIGHDVQMGNHCLMKEGSALGGHVIVKDYVTFGKRAAVHQFVEIGELASLEDHAALTQDLPPYCTVVGNRAKLIGINPNIKQSSLSSEEISQLKEAYHTLFETKQSPKVYALHALTTTNSEILKKLYHTIAHSKRGIPFKRNENVN